MRQTLRLVWLLSVLSLSCERGPAVTLARGALALTVQLPALYPETIEYDATRGKFLVGSFRQGAIYVVDDQGATSPLVTDPRLCSVLGIAVDAQRGRLWAVSSDLGASIKPSSAGPKHLAFVGEYELSTGKPLAYADLAPLVPGNHLLNGLALDTAGNAYVTDSFSPLIYKVSAAGNASVFLHSAEFEGDGINLNGLVVHPDGYLLVVKKSDGALFKVPLATPSAFTRVKLDRPLLAGDGLVLVGKSDLLVVANQTPNAKPNAVFTLTSSDGWASARPGATLPLGNVYPTTAVLREQKIYVVHSQLNQLIQAPPPQKSGFQARAMIEEVARVVH